MTTTENPNPIIALFEKSLRALSKQDAAAPDQFDQEIAGLVNADIDTERTGTEFLTFLNAWTTGDNLPDGPHSDELEAVLLDNDLARSSEAVSAASQELANRVLATTSNPVLVAFRESLTHIGGSGATPLYGVAMDLLDGLGGPGPAFDFARYDSASSESQIDAERATSDAEVTQARLVLHALTLIDD